MHIDTPAAPELARSGDDLAEHLAGDIVIPPCPRVLAEFSTEIRSPDPDMRRLAALIGNDPGLAAAMLKTVNSPFYGLRTKAGTVQQSLAILGLRASVNLVAALMLRSAFKGADGPLMQRFWDNAMRLAATAAGITSRVKGVSPDEAHTFLLFRDCGMAVMAARFEDYAVAAARGEPMRGPERIAAEDLRFRFNHALVGHALARSWFLPDALCGAILHHHRLDLVMSGNRLVADGAAKLIAFGLLADQLIALQDGRGLCPDWREGEDFVLRTLGIGAEDIVEMSGALA